MCLAELYTHNVSGAVLSRTQPTLSNNNTSNTSAVCTWIASGHFQFASTMKKRSKSVDGAAVGYNWLIKHTRMHQFTPPRYPILFEYKPRRFAQRRTTRNTLMKLSRFGVSYRSDHTQSRRQNRPDQYPINNSGPAGRTLIMSSVTRGPLSDFSVAGSTPSSTASSRMLIVSGIAFRGKIAIWRSMLISS